MLQSFYKPKKFSDDLKKKKFLSTLIVRKKQTYRNDLYHDMHQYKRYSKIYFKITLLYRLCKFHNVADKWIPKLFFFKKSQKYFKKKEFQKYLKKGISKNALKLYLQKYIAGRYILRSWDARSAWSIFS